LDAMVDIARAEMGPRAHLVHSIRQMSPARKRDRAGTVRKQDFIWTVFVRRAWVAVT